MDRNFLLIKKLPQRLPSGHILLSLMQLGTAEAMKTAMDLSDGIFLEILTSIP
jgi:hypothetical protein